MEKDLIHWPSQIQMDHTGMSRKLYQALLYEHDPNLWPTTVNCIFCVYLYVGEKER